MNRLISNDYLLSPFQGFGLIDFLSTKGVALCYCYHPFRVFYNRPEGARATAQGIALCNNNDNI